MSRFRQLDAVPGNSRPLSSGTETTVRPSLQGLPLARWHRSEGDWRAAMQAYAAALEHDRSHLEGWLGQIQMLIQLGELREAEAWTAKALEHFRHNGDLLAARAQVLVRLGQLAAAHACVDAAWQQPGESSYRWQVRGEVQLAARNPTAELAWSRAWTLAPECSTAMELSATAVLHRAPRVAVLWAARACDTPPTTAGAWRQRVCAWLAAGNVPQAQLALRELQARYPSREAWGCCPVEVVRANRWWRRLWRSFFGGSLR